VVVVVHGGDGTTSMTPGGNRPWAPCAAFWADAMGTAMLPLCAVSADTDAVLPENSVNATPSSIGRSIIGSRCCGKPRGDSEIPAPT
jgi:hypothetical protein